MPTVRSAATKDACATGSRQVSATSQKLHSELYDKLACWCNTNEYEKGGEISAGEAKVNELKLMQAMLMGGSVTQGVDPAHRYLSTAAWRVAPPVLHF